MRKKKMQEELINAGAMLNPPNVDNLRVFDYQTDDDGYPRLRKGMLLRTKTREYHYVRLYVVTKIDNYFKLINVVTGNTADPNTLFGSVAPDYVQVLKNPFLELFDLKE